MVTLHTARWSLPMIGRLMTCFNAQQISERQRALLPSPRVPNYCVESVTLGTGTRTATVFHNSFLSSLYSSGQTDEIQEGNKCSILLKRPLEGEKKPTRETLIAPFQSDSFLVVRLRPDRRRRLQGKDIHSTLLRDFSSARD